MTGAGTAVGRDDGYEYSVTTMSVFWPRNEYEKLLARWPHLSAHVGATWDVHRQQVERHCALVDRAGHKVNQLPGSVAEFEVFLKGKGITAPAADDLFGYPDLRTVTAAHGLLATGAEHRVLVRLRAQVQAVLPPARLGHPGLT